MNYTFETLNDKEFELICLDLLNLKFKYELQSFKKGKDKGIDLRYSSSKNSNEIICQAKHYIQSKYAQLKSTLKNEELPKIQKLAPGRYIVLTSLSLSPQEKDDLKSILSPYVLSANDIIDQEVLNGYLREFPEIEKKHFKLWLPSINVLQSVLNNAVEQRTIYDLERIKKKIPIYVMTKNFDKANEILLKEKLLLITGQPGVGKTTLADILLYEKAGKNFFISKIENTREGEDVFNPDPEIKQVFYFDDFFGANYMEIINSNQTESQLTSFIERIRVTPNKLMILTTRTIILNQAIENYEKIARSRMATDGFEIKLGDYSLFEKAQILYNHLFFRDIPESLREAITLNRNYRAIIRHKNYTPRIIEFITDAKKIKEFTPQQYLDFIQANLKNPEKIWRHSFNIQIGYFDRTLLLTLFSFNTSIEEPYLLHAFENRLNYEKEQNQMINSDQFNQSMRILVDGFISSAIKNQSGTREYSFINPSLADFLLAYVSESYQERKSIISSIIYFEQLSRFNFTGQMALDISLQIILRDKIAANLLKSCKVLNNQESSDQLNVLELDVLVTYCSDVNIDGLLLEHFKMIDLSNNTWTITNKLFFILRNINDAPLTFNFIRDNFFLIVERMMEDLIDLDDAKALAEIFEIYDFNMSEYSGSPEGCKKIEKVIDNILSSTIEAIKDNNQYIEDIRMIEREYEQEVHGLSEKLQTVLSIEYDNSEYSFEHDKDEWQRLIYKNITDQREEKEAWLEREDYYERKESLHEMKAEEDAIDDLFS